MNATAAKFSSARDAELERGPTGWSWRGVGRLVGLFVRELIGWALVVCAIYVFRISLVYLNRSPTQLIEAVLAAFIGYTLFRGGLGLVKVAVAARAFRPTE